MGDRSALDYWESALKTRHDALGYNYEALLEDHHALGIILSRHNTRVNETSPKSRLPAELLQHTFRLLRDNVEYQDLEPSNWVPRSETLEKPYESPAWTIVTQVCRRWRSIALNDALLWRDIRVLSHQTFIDRMLALSKSSPLLIRARLAKTGSRLHHKLASIFDSALRDISTASRVSSLDICAFDGHDAMSAICASTLLPALDRLTMRLDNSPILERREFTWNNITEKAPNLRHLFLSGFLFTSDILHTPYASLTKLRIRGGTENMDEIHMRASTLLRSVACLPALRELLLEDISARADDAQAALSLGIELSIERVVFSHDDLRASLPFISVLASIAVQLSVHTHYADKSSIPTLLDHCPLPLKPEFLSISFFLMEEVLGVYVRYPPQSSTTNTRWPRELILHLFSEYRYPDGSTPRVLFDFEDKNGDWPSNLLEDSLAHIEGSEEFSFCVDDFMYHTSWREEHWVRLASLPAKSIEAFNEEAYTLFSILAENPHAFPCLEKIIIFDEDSTGRIWNDDVDDYEGWMEAREPPYDSADLVLQTVRLRQERGPRPFKCIMLPKRYLEDDWVAELRDLVEVVEESQHGDHCHCHKVHDPYVDFSQT